MADHFNLIRSVLKTLGMSAEAAEDIIDRIKDFLSDKDQKSSPVRKFPYKIRDDFLSPAEQSFYHVLKSCVSDKALVCPKVSLSDLVYVSSRDPSEFRIYTNKIDRKHVDFVLTDPKSVRPIVAIELDDKSHRREDRQERDAFVQQVFQAAKLPLLRIPVRHTYSSEEIRKTLLPYLDGKVDVKITPAIPVGENDAPPACPKCGTEMVVRTAKVGNNSGEKFWGCPNYPKCRGTQKYLASESK